MDYVIDHSFCDTFWLARAAVHEVNRRKYDNERGYFTGPRHWHLELQSRYDLHPIVVKIIKLGVRPVNWQLLLLEWPHVSTDDETQIAYTRDDRKGVDNVQTRTSLGKYVSRHWPHIADHIRRDWVGTFGNHKYAIWDTKEEIIAGVELGPRSCMKSGYGSIPFKSSDNYELCEWFAGDKARKVRWDHHPYAVYAPALGWRMAVRLDPGKPDIVMGRALLHIEDKIWVRSYKRETAGDDACSGTDERLETWLRDQGYRKSSEWRLGTRFARVEHPDGGTLMPYIDGNNRDVEVGHGTVTLEDGGATCDNTDGTVDEKEVYGTCEDCNADVLEDDDDRIWTGPNEERLVGGCCSQGYTHVCGAGHRGGVRHYYVEEGNAVDVDGTDYDRENLPETVCELADGEYALREDCVCCYDGEMRLPDDCVCCETDDEWYEATDEDIVEIDGKWYRTDDDDVTECADDVYRLKSDCWEDAHTNDWYPNSVALVNLSDGDYHPDTLRNLANSA